MPGGAGWEVGSRVIQGSYTLSCQLLEGHEQRLILMQLAPLLIFTEEENADVKWLLQRQAASSCQSQNPTLQTAPSVPFHPALLPPFDLRKFKKINLFIFNWWIIALQSCVGSCHTSTMNQPQVYICPLPLEPPSHPSRLSQRTGFELPVSCSKFPLAV